MSSSSFTRMCQGSSRALRCAVRLHRAGHRASCGMLYPRPPSAGGPPATCACCGYPQRAAEPQPEGGTTLSRARSVWATHRCRSVAASRQTLDLTSRTYYLNIAVRTGLSGETPEGAHAVVSLSRLSLYTVFFTCGGVQCFTACLVLANQTLPLSIIFVTSPPRAHTISHATRDGRRRPHRRAQKTQCAAAHGPDASRGELESLSHSLPHFALKLDCALHCDLGLHVLPQVRAQLH